MEHYINGKVLYFNLYSININIRYLHLKHKNNEKPKQKKKNDRNKNYDHKKSGKKWKIKNTPPRPNV